MENENARYLYKTRLRVAIEFDVISHICQSHIHLNVILSVGPQRHPEHFPNVILSGVEGFL